MKIKTMRLSGFCLVIGIITLLTLAVSACSSGSSSTSVVTSSSNSSTTTEINATTTKTTTYFLKNHHHRQGYRDINFDCDFTDQPAEPEAGFHPEFYRHRNLFRRFNRGCQFPGNLAQFRYDYRGIYQPSGGLLTAMTTRDCPRLRPHIRI